MLLRFGFPLLETAASHPSHLGEGRGAGAWAGGSEAGAVCVDTEVGAGHLCGRILGGPSWKAAQAHLLCLGIYYFTFISSSEMGNLSLDWPHKEPECRSRCQILCCILRSLGDS